ncbi:MAG: hypothetical protein KAI83_13120 [Thiomargarita sp.]|nr:hypothetical protein [Thiomargarita sp.]
MVSNNVSNIAGNGTAGHQDGSANDAMFYHPGELIKDADGNLYIADFFNHRIRKIDTNNNNTVSTIAGTGTAGYSGDGGPAIYAELNYPGGITLDNTGNLYIGDYYNHRIRKIDIDGTITTVAGNGIPGHSGDGELATEAQLNVPTDVVFDSVGNMYITDHRNHIIRKVDTNGIITTVAGIPGNGGYNGDNIPADEAKFNLPLGIRIDSEDNLYIADYGNHRIRKLTKVNLLKYQVDLQRAEPKGDASWISDLTISVGTANDAVEYVNTTNNSGEGFLTLNKPLDANDYFCVRGEYSLANKVIPPFTMIDGKIRFSENNGQNSHLLEGDVAKLDSSMKIVAGMDGTIDGIDSSYMIDNPNLIDINKNGDFTDDLTLLMNNFNKTPLNGTTIHQSACEETVVVSGDSMLRRGRRDGKKGLNQLLVNALPSDIVPGDSFDVTLTIHATETNPINGVQFYLEYEPETLRINQVTPTALLDVLLNDFDNSQGLLNVIVMAWKTPASTSAFDLATINFTLLKEGGEKTLHFSEDAQQKNIAFTGSKFVKNLEEVVSLQANTSISTASCQLYAVNDKGLNNSQFFTVNLVDFTVSALGPMYKGHDIEALAIHPETNMIYAASGDNVTNEKQGHFYRVDGENGELFPVGSSGFKEIEDLAFSPDGTLYAWAKGDGLITINLTTGVGTLELPYDKPLIEGLTLKKNEGKVFFGAVGNDLWQYDWNTDTLDVICPDKLLGETEALEIMSNGLLLIGTHNVPFGLHAFDVETCQVIEADETLSHQYNDVEGIALPVAACSK